MSYGTEYRVAYSHPGDSRVRRATPCESIEQARRCAVTFEANSMLDVVIEQRQVGAWEPTETGEQS